MLKRIRHWSSFAITLFCTGYFVARLSATHGWLGLYGMAWAFLLGAELTERFSSGRK